MMNTCSECQAPYAQSLSDDDVAHLGNEWHLTIPLGVEGLAKAIIYPLGIMIAKGVARAYFSNLAFCIDCRRKPSPGKDPYLWVNVLSFMGMMTFFLFFLAPLGWLFFAAAVLVMRAKLKQFRAHPSAAEVRFALNALGTFTTAVLAHTVILIVFGFVVYAFTKDPGFRW